MFRLMSIMYSEQITIKTDMAESILGLIFGHQNKNIPDYAITWCKMFGTKQKIIYLKHTSKWTFICLMGTHIN